MASAAAQQYFASFGPAEQQRIRASWGGSDLMDEWFQNAVNAGATGGQRTRGEATATDATTGSTPQGYKNTGTSPFADMIRARAKAERWSEDFERFSDAQIEAWQQYYDPSTGRFRSENDPSGAATYDKPAECPPGTTYHGTRCVAYKDLPAWAQEPAMFGGQQAAGPAQPAIFGQGPAVNPLQGLMAGLPQADMRAGGFRAGGGGGIQTSISDLMTAQQQMQPQYGAPLQSSTDNLLRAATSGAKPAPMMPGTLGTGWTSGQDGLTQMMARRQRGGAQNAGSWWA